MMQTHRKQKGFTLAETLIVLGIVLILLLVSAIAIFKYMRNLQKLEDDDFAKELFIVAQNHLSAAHSQGYLGRTGFGTEETDADGNGTGIYYYVVSQENAQAMLSDSGSILGLMLPAYSLDETVRLGGNYIIRYHKDSGMVLDVFHWTSSGRYSLSYQDSYYAGLLSNKANRDALKEFEAGGGAVVGHYGGEEAPSPDTPFSVHHGSISNSGATAPTPLESPTILVVNGEQLFVTVQENNGSDVTGDPGYSLQLLITGETSHVTRTLQLNKTLTPVLSGGVWTYTVILDDITTDSGHFFQRFCSNADNNLIPGEDVTIQAKAFSSTELTGVAFSTKKTVNSLFGDGTDANAHEATIYAFRHLENLDPDVSGVNSSFFRAAKQTTNLTWPDSITVTLKDGASAAPDNCFRPVSPGYALDYNGQKHSISGVRVENEGDSGLFGTLVSGSSVENLKLVDFTVTGTGTGSTGALAGSASGTDVTNVLAIHSGSAATVTVTGAGSTGGLIGTVSGGTISKCAAALVIRSTGGNAGGLIGTADGTAEISACYSGGHTTDGAYSSTAFNVTGAGSVGGLVGSFSGAWIEYSYSTCSASGATAGGLVGTVGSGTILDCYATGLVSGTSARGAFAGSCSGSVTGSRFYGIINEGLGSGTASGVTALDLNANTYREFVEDSSGWTPDSAIPYDTRLNVYYGGKYWAETRLGSGISATDFVSTHYGDWPAPELWVVNAMN